MPAIVAPPRLGALVVLFAVLTWTPPTESFDTTTATTTATTSASTTADWSGTHDYVVSALNCWLGNGRWSLLYEGFSTTMRAHTYSASRVLSISFVINTPCACASRY